jgi:hypothetical protein
MLFSRLTYMPDNDPAIGSPAQVLLLFDKEWTSLIASGANSYR